MAVKYGEKSPVCYGYIIEAVIINVLMTYKDEVSAMHMKTVFLNIFTLLIYLIPLPGFAAGAYVLQDKIITPNSDQTPPVVEYTENQT